MKPNENSQYSSLNGRGIDWCYNAGRKQMKMWLVHGLLGMADSVSVRVAIPLWLVFSVSLAKSMALILLQ